MQPIAAALARAAAVLLLAAAPAAAQDYPGKPIKVVIPVAAGGAGEMIMRTLMTVLETRVLKPIVLEHRPGAGGNVAAQYVLDQAPDGHTLLLAVTNNLAINQFLFKNMKFDPLAAFTPITQVVDIPAAIFISGKLEAKTLQEFIAYAKARPGQLNYASPAVGTTLHLGSVMLGRIAGIEMVHVPYRGTVAAITDVLSNQVQMFMIGYNVGLPHLHNGGLKVLAVTHTERLKVAPDVPTAAEAGVPGLVIGNWWGLVGPKGMDPKIVSLIQREFRQALEDPKVRARLENLAIVPVGSTPEDFAAFVKAEAAKWEPLVKVSGAKVE
jgi:tripartite-type tricarboxylate transporter receptor subunit TctC